MAAAQLESAKNRSMPVDETANSPDALEEGITQLLDEDIHEASKNCSMSFIKIQMCE